MAYYKAGRNAEALKEIRRALDSGSPLENRRELEQVAAQLSGK
jgi:hypothetical protein